MKITATFFRAFAFTAAAAALLGAVPTHSATKAGLTQAQGNSPWHTNYAPLFGDCFASDRGAGSTNKTEHATWARQQSMDTLISNLWAKIQMIYNCPDVSDEQAVTAFGEISTLIARRAPDAGCFNGDRGIINTDPAVHQNWARARQRTQVRDNLGAKAAAALRCLTETNRVDFFAEASVMLASVPSAAANGLRILLQDKQFVPLEATVKDGDTIEICNKDRFFHSPFSFSNYNKFGSSKGMVIRPGECFTHVVRNPTNESICVKLFDEMHSSEKLLLTVLPSSGNAANRPCEKDEEKPPGVTPCNPSERAAWAKMLGTWDAPYGDITFSGSCEEVSGFWRQGPYGDKGTSQRGEITGGRVNGTTVTFNYTQSWNDKTGPTSYTLIGNTMEGSSGWGTLKRK